MAYAHSDKREIDAPQYMANPAPDVRTREKLEGGKAFILHTEFEPAGDQPTAIKELSEGLRNGERDQVLLGATGTGKTFTMAKMIEETQRPAIILAPNKTLAAQLYGEFKGFFPDNAVEYFVSYYDYYQPEAYVARSDTFIEKESQINEQIDRMRHSATRALLERDDVIIVASVSCIYGIGSVETYGAMTQDIHVGKTYDQRQIIADLVAQAYKRNDAGFQRGCFRVRGDNLEVWPAHLDDRAWSLSFFGEELESITEYDPLTGQKTDKFEKVRIYANSHYVTPKPTMMQAVIGIKKELRMRLDQLVGDGKLLEAQRLEQRCTFDLEMLEATGVCNGIENYSRYLTGRAPGEPPPTLFEFIPDNAIVFADESHVSVPQIGGMYKGDFRRKMTLAEHGFRLPSCMDNRPLKFEEWDAMRPQSVFVSATLINRCVACALHKLPMTFLGPHFAIMNRDIPACEGETRQAFDFFAFKNVVIDGRLLCTCRDGFGLFRVPDNYVCVSTDKNGTFTWVTVENLSNVRGCNRDKFVHRQTTRRHPVRPEQRHTILQPASPVWYLRKVTETKAFLFSAERTMVCRNNRKCPGLKTCPKTVLVLFIPERRGHHTACSMVPIFVEIFRFVQEKVLDQGFTPDAFALHFSTADRLVGFLAGGVNDVQRHARHVRDHDRAVGRLAFNLSGAGIGMRLWSGVPFSEQF
jgi:hypothetical protein